MTEQEVDELVKAALGTYRKLDEFIPAQDAIRTMATALKSLIADGERLDWLEKNAHWSEDEDSDGNVYAFRTSEWVTFDDQREENPQSLRQAIDERMVQA